MKNWIPQKTLLVSTTFGAVFCVLLYFFSLWYVLWEIKKIENYYNDTESVSSKEEKTRFLKSLAENNKESIKLLREFFIRKGDEVKFIEQIEDIGRRSSIRFKIDSIDVAPNQVKNSKEDVFVKMKIEGSWHNIMAFVDTLEKTTFGVSVQDLNLDVTDSSGWSGSIGFVVFRER